MRCQISDKFYFDPKSGEVTDKNGAVLFEDKTINWIYRPREDLPLYVVERESGLTLYNENGKVMKGAENVKNIEVRSDGSYIVSNNHRHLKIKGDCSEVSYGKELFINNDVDLEVRTKHFIIQKDSFKNKYIFRTIAGQEFATGTGYRLADDKYENPKYIVVQNGLDDTTETLYHHLGGALKHAEDVNHILWSKDAFTTSRYVSKSVVTNGRKSTYVAKERFTHKLPEYYGRMVRRCLMGLIVLTTVGGCLFKGVQEKAEFNNTEATYLGIKDGYATFDTDGNRNTVEIKSQKRISLQSADEIGYLQNKTHSVSTWKALMRNIELERQ